MGATVLSLGWWETTKGGRADVGAVVGGGCAEEDGAVVSSGGSSGVGMVVGAISVGDGVGLNGRGSGDGDCKEEEG